MCCNVFNQSKDENNYRQFIKKLDWLSGKTLKFSGFFLHFGYYWVDWMT